MRKFEVIVKKYKERSVVCKYYCVAVLTMLSLTNGQGQNYTPIKLLIDKTNLYFSDT